MYHSPNYNGKVFLNPIPTKVGGFGNTLQILAELFKKHPNRSPSKKAGPFYANPQLLNNLPPDTLRITWLGHSSLLIETDGKRFLIDPVWAKYASPIPKLGPERFFDPPLGLTDLPPLDAVIISHNHYDHLDKHAVKTLAKSGVKFYCSLGVGRHLTGWGISISQIEELDWWQQIDLHNGFTLTAAPARHFSGRGMTDRNKTLWASYVIKSPNYSVYYGADSGMHPLFKEIGEQLGPFDLTMLEIGAYNDLWKDIHMGPQDATDAHLALNGNVMMPIHWGTFNLAFHTWTEPAEQVMAEAEKKHIKLLLPRPGFTYVYNGESYIDKWWEELQ